MSDTNQARFWETRYQNNEDRWDLGGPTPVFQQLARAGTLTPGALIILGAGRGYDARLFARHQFQVTAVDFAAAAIAAMAAADDPHHPVHIVQADFFWLPPAFNGRFDYVLDYTCYCAILPEKRGAYADLVTRLLKPNGQLIMLAFPIGHRPGGPPFVVQPAEIISRFQQRGFTLRRREKHPDSVPERQPYEELLILSKDTTP